MQIREALIKGLSAGQGVFDEKVVDELERRVLKMKPQFPAKYAFTTGRNWAISQKRHRAAQARRAVVAALKAEKERQEREHLERCRDEFLGIQAKIAPTLQLTQLRQLRILWLRVFQGMSDLDCAKLFISTSRDLRHQWKRRGKKLVWPHASKELQEFLSRNASPKQ